MLSSTFRVSLLLSLLWRRLEAVYLGDQVEVEAGARTFEEFVTNHGRRYEVDSHEYHARRQLFEESLAAVQAHNARTDRSWTATVNEWSDYTPEELASLSGYRDSALRRPASAALRRVASHDATGSSGRLNTSHAAVREPRPSSSFLEASRGYSSIAGKLRGILHAGTVNALAAVPMAQLKEAGESAAWDHLWTSQEDQVHSQGCGNCWAAATASMLEAHHEIYQKKQRHFNFLEITRCSMNPYSCGGSGHCDGSVPELGLQHLMVNGLGPNSHLPEDGFTVDSIACPDSAKPIVAENEAPPHEAVVGYREAAPQHPGRSFGLMGWERLPENQAWSMMRALYNRGPVAVAVGTGWKQYKEGIFDSCPPDIVITHSMLVVGYGKGMDVLGKQKPYWKIQNSWGTTWGEKGLGRFLRHTNEGEYCGIDSAPSEGSECVSGRSQVRVCGMCGLLYDAVVPHFGAKEGSTEQAAREALQQDDAQDDASGSASASQPSALSQKDASHTAKKASEAETIAAIARKAVAESGVLRERSQGSADGAALTRAAKN